MNSDEDLDETIAELIASSGRCFECKDRLKPDSNSMVCNRCTNMKNIDKIKFIVIVEQSMIKHKVVVHYCQWNGNEHELTTLVRHINASNQETNHMSQFSASLVKISEEAVDAHVKLHFGDLNTLFMKHVGTFTCPFRTATSESLDKYFCDCQLGKHFI